MGLSAQAVGVASAKGGAIAGQGRGWPFAGCDRRDSGSLLFSVSRGPVAPDDHVFLRHQFLSGGEGKALHVLCDSALLLNP